MRESNELWRRLARLVLRALACVPTFLMSGVSLECAANEPPTAVPREWRVEVQTRISAFERRSARIPSTTIELKSNGEVTEIREQFKTEPKMMAKKTVSPEITAAGLHLVWSVLEDAPLLGGNVEDTDYCHMLIETNDWTWKRSWFTRGTVMDAGDRARVTFHGLIQGDKIDLTSFRTRHRTPAEIRERWLKEPYNRNYYINWQGIAWSGDESFGFNKRVLDDPNVELAKDLRTLMNSLADLRDRYVDREAKGDKAVEFLFESKATHATTIKIKGLKEFSEAGPSRRNARSPSPEST